MSNIQSALLPSADHKTGPEDLPGPEEHPSPVVAQHDPSNTAHHDIQQPGTERENGMVIWDPEEVREEMFEKGWCPHQIRYLSRRYGSKGLELFADLYEDRKLLRPEDHRPCSQKKRCIAYNKTKHTAECPGGGCYMVKVPYGDLVQVIQRGGIPLLSIQEHSDTEVSLHVHERHFRSDYTTFSHVWADGLGNPKENALPFCQIKLLQSLLSHDTVNEANTWIKYMDNTIYGWPSIKMFWIDTLCIPTKDSILRSQCIDAMSSIYAGSSRVFVLDKELMETPIRRRHRVTNVSDCLIRIACSVWMCRSWTLQEAILPGQCLFLFANGDIFQPASTTIDPDANLSPGSYTMSRQFIKKTTLRIISADRESSPEDIHSFTSIWNNLVGRSTTQREDLYIVLASCLGFKLRQFRDIPTLEEKIKHIIFSYSELPLSLFFNKGPRLRSASQHNNRWVPTQVGSSLLSDNCCTFAFPLRSGYKYCDQEAFLQLRVCERHEIILIYEVVSMPKIYIVTTRYGDRYEIKRVIQENDTFELTGYAALCFIFSSQYCPDCSSTHGACFLIPGPRVPGTVDHKQSVFEMVYSSPAIQTPIIEDSHNGHGDDGKGKDYKCKHCHGEHCGRPVPVQRIEGPRSFRVKFGESACSFTITTNAEYTANSFATHDTDPIPGFKPLKRQRLQKQFHSHLGEAIMVLYSVLISKVWLFDMPVALPYLSTLFWPSESGDRGWLISVGIPFAFLTLAPFWMVANLPSAFVVYLMVRARDYALLYQSYDDNTLVDKVSRLLTAVGRAIYNFPGDIFAFFSGVGRFARPQREATHPHAD